MVTAGGRFIVLVVLMTTEILSTPLPSVVGDIVQVLTGLIENQGSRLTRLEESISGMRNEINEKRCETGILTFRPYLQANLIGPDGRPRRTHAIHVNFARPFTTVPWVSLGFVHLETERSEHVRVDMTVEARSPYGFDAQALDWDSSKVYAVFASWIACSI